MARNAWNAANVLLALLFLCAPALASEPMVSVPPIPLTAAVASGQKEIVVTGSGELQDTLKLANQTLACAPGVVITWKMEPTKNAIESGNNVTISACSLSFLPTTPAGDVPVTADGPHGISCRGCSGLDLRNVMVSSFKGDGLYVGPGRDSARTPSSNVTIRGSRFVANGRNGVSVVSVKGLVAEGNLFSQTQGNPGAGIDFEPIAATDYLQDVKMVDNASVDNAGYCVIAALARLTEKSPPVSIAVLRHTCRGERNVQVRVDGFQPLNSDGSPATVPPGFVLIESTTLYGTRP